MADDELDFSAEEWRDMSPAQRVGLCMRLATRMREIAKEASPAQRAAYLRIADEWDTLRREIEKLS